VTIEPSITPVAELHAQGKTKPASAGDVHALGSLR
jgi:hypothetical protein